MGETRTYRVCTLCEATCGIEVTVREDGTARVRGDRDDPFSRGFICPKATAMATLHTDPDRLRQPMRRSAGGFEPIGWEEAYTLVIERLTAIRDDHGENAIGTYLGNPNAHSMQSLIYGSVFQRALQTRNRFSASSVDQLPKMVSSALLFGGALTIPIPDVDRTDFLLVLGGNPRVSNGSLMTAPDMPGRLDAILERGGSVVVIDPRRSETAARASEHHFIRPGTDAALLLAMVHVMFAEGLVAPGAAEALLDGVPGLRDAVADFTPQAAAAHCGLDASTIVDLTRRFCAAPSAACYGRIGTTCQTFGTLASWAVDLVNVLSGNLDRPGGVMWPLPAANTGGNLGQNATRRPARLARSHSRVRGLPEMFGEYPTATLADEILTPGDGQIRAMVTIGGNPLLSAPGGTRLREAFESLEFMVAIDMYLNETTRHADVILPVPSALERDHYDLAFYQLSVRNVAKYSPAAFTRPEGQPDEWELLLTLAKGMMGMAEVPLSAADDFVFGELLRREVGEDGGRWPGLTADEVKGALEGLGGPQRVLEVLLRTGPHGDGFGRDPAGLTLRKLIDAPHGIDLGPLQPRLPEVLSTEGARIDLLPGVLVDDLGRLKQAMAEPSPPLVLIGRRSLRSNNSWMHNQRQLIKGPARCTLLVHPRDAEAHGLHDGGRARVCGRTDELEVDVVVSDEVMPGVVSLPHGFGHGQPGTRLSVAAERPGVNVNLLTDDRRIDPVSGNAALNGVPVTLQTV